MQRSDPFMVILRAAILVVGIWAIYAQVSVLIGRTFHELLTGAWIPALGLLFVTAAWRKSGPSIDIPASELQLSSEYRRRIILLALVSVAGVVIFRPGNWIAAAIYVIAVFMIFALIGDRLTQRTVPNESTSTKHQSWIVMIVIVASMVVTICDHRLNWDDAKYLRHVVNAIEYPDEPMMVYEHLHGVKELKIYHPSVRLQTYELTVAAISKLSGMSYLFVFYLLLPPIWAGLAVMAQWELIRRLAGKHATLALLATFVLLVVWGRYRSYGDFAFDFVGFGIFVMFAVPALILATLDFAEKRNLRTWILLFLATWTGCLFTSTAYAVAPVAVSLVLISCYGVLFPKIREFTFGFLATAWCPLLLAYVAFVAPIVPPIDVDSPGNAHFVFTGAQGRIALVLFAVAPFLLLFKRLQSSRWMLRYTALTFLILLSGFTLNWIGRVSSLLSWRLLWAIPVPVIIGVGFAAAIDICQKRLRLSGTRRNFTALAGLAALAFTFSITGKTVLYRNFQWPALKVDQTSYPDVLSLVQCSTPTDLVLAPTQVAVPTSGLLGAPSLIAVRGHYLSYLSGQWGEAETARRKRLLNVVQGKRNSMADIVWTRDQIFSGPINRIVLKKQQTNLQPLKDMLLSLKVDRVELNKWELWLPNTTGQEAMQLRSCLERAGYQNRKRAQKY